jgi:hypothetical protein
MRKTATAANKKSIISLIYMNITLEKNIIID